ncbi:MAG: ABC transporter ATP-binding protein [Xanthomonadales bacterium]|nr:ABC transporter ATP-binding protein [Xanthomonadales bacterium]
MSETAHPVLQVDSLAVGFAGRPVLRDFSLTLERGTIGALLGASGTGKTTLLRAIAGFEPIESGSVHLDGELLEGNGTHRPPHRRGIGMVFQDHALFPHLDAAGNVGFGLRGLDRAARSVRVAELLTQVGLADRATAMPHQLSGGEQQRVALARALAPRPALLLLDEPFANLDRPLRVELAHAFRGWLHEAGTTALVVTHDPLEALNLADRLGVLDDGRLQQWDAPHRVWQAPSSRRVAGMLSEITVIAGERDSVGLARCALGVVRASTPGAAGAVDVVLRPGDVVLDSTSRQRATVEARRFRGSHVALVVRLGSDEIIEVEDDPAAPRQPGDQVRLSCRRPVPCYPSSG